MPHQMPIPPEPPLFAEMSRPAIVRAYIDGAWHTVRVLKRLPGGKLMVATYSPKKGWRKLAKAIHEAETRHNGVS